MRRDGSGRRAAVGRGPQRLIPHAKAPGDRKLDQAIPIEQLSRSPYDRRTAISMAYDIRYEFFDKNGKAVGSVVGVFSARPSIAWTDFVAYASAGQHHAQ
jgi:hypothetical protein